LAVAVGLGKQGLKSAGWIRVDVRGSERGFAAWTAVQFLGWIYAGVETPAFRPTDVDLSAGTPGSLRVGTSRVGLSDVIVRRLGGCGSAVVPSVFGVGLVGQGLQCLLNWRYLRCGQSRAPSKATKSKYKGNRRSFDFAQDDRPFTLAHNARKPPLRMTGQWGRRVWGSDSKILCVVAGV
jgi:hypothetical protein